tara:strand:- start:45290 stop:45553 length:264 start_codon:yes stop_codon:yes gene_type:complete
VTAKAIGTISWAFDKVFKTTGSVLHSLSNRLGKKNLYDVSICTKDGEIIDIHTAVNRYKIESILRSMEDFRSVLVDIRTHRRDNGTF